MRIKKTNGSTVIQSSILYFYYNIKRLIKSHKIGNISKQMKCHI